MLFNLCFIIPSTDALRPIIMNNACPSRITAAAGTEVSQDFFSNSHHLLTKTKFYNPTIVFINVVLLDQAFAHCPKFLTAG